MNKTIFEMILCCIIFILFILILFYVVPQFETLSYTIQDVYVYCCEKA